MSVDNGVFFFYYTDKHVRYLREDGDRGDATLRKSGRTSELRAGPECWASC